MPWCQIIVPAQRGPKPQLQRVSIVDPLPATPTRYADCIVGDDDTRYEVVDGQGEKDYAACGNSGVLKGVERPRPEPMSGQVQVQITF